MKKVIDGKMYNTETAEMLAEYWNGLGNSDYYHFNEGLFRTKKGNYFLYGEGGPASKWASKSGKYSNEGSDIVEFSRDEAMEWLSTNGFPDVIEREFPDLLEEA